MGGRSVLGRVLLDGTYRRGRVRRQPIPKSSGNGTRTLEIPDAEDKIVQRAVVQAIQPFLDPAFDERSFGFRPGLGARARLGLREAMTQQTGNWTWITEDIRDAFTQVPHRRLFDVLRRKGLDDAMLALIAEVIGNDRGRGLPQGGCLSPLLLNVYLRPFPGSALAAAAPGSAAGARRGRPAHRGPRTGSRPNRSTWSCNGCSARRACP